MTTAAAQQMLCLRRATTGLFVTLVIGQQWIMTMMNNSIQVETEVVLSQPFNLTMTLSAAVTSSTGTGTSSLNSTTTSNLSSLSEAPTTAESPAEAAAAASEEAAEEKTPSSESSNTDKQPQEQQQKQQKLEQSPQPKPAAVKPKWETEAEKRAKRRQRFRQWHKEREEKQARKKATQQPEQSQQKQQQEQKQQKQKQQKQPKQQSPPSPPPPPPTLEEQKKRGFGYPKYRDTKFPPPVQAVLKKYKVKKRTEPPVSLQQLEEIVQQTKQQKQSSWQPYAGPATQKDHSIQRIYYTNLAKNLVRREITETHLKNLHSNTGVPFKRMEAKKGDTNVCTSKNTDKKCIGVSGLSYSLLNILQNENVTGPTLVLEDDWVWHDANFDRLYTAMEMLPNDWDLVRFDCWEMSQKQFAANIAQPYLINTTTYTTPQTSWCQSDRLCKRRFYGGTHAMLFRGRPSSNHKLQQTWSIQPYDDVDGRISTEGGHQFGLISYCLNLGWGSFIEIPTEVSDIPKDVVHQ